MTLFFVSLILLCIGALLPVIFCKKSVFSRWASSGFSIAGSVAGLSFAIHTLISQSTKTWHIPWSMPYGSFSLSVDSLSAIFLIPLFMLSLLSTIYAIEYMKDYGSPFTRTLHWFFYNVLIASMALVCTASNAILFLLAWEIMSLSSFFLVLLKHDDKESQDAAWIYLIATHIGAACLLVFFLLASSQTGSCDFDSYTTHSFSRGIAGILFSASIIGFGSKAGFVPFHVWLPRAHPAAPSHVSALMSGVMIKMGIYGILRSLSFLGSFEAWWGFVLVAIGCTSGILGILLALGQHDLKRLLAYSSVENIGIIALCIGGGILGVSFHIAPLAILGFCAALLHVVNHAFFKGILFLSAGSVLHSTGTVHMDSLGGLAKKMPHTARSFLIGSVAICGLPVLNGFVSEFLIYLGSFYGIQSTNMVLFLMSTIIMTSIALIGGLAVVCFTKANSAVFLGEPRSTVTVHQDAGKFMQWSMNSLVFLCFVIGLGFWFIIPLFASPISIITSHPIDTVTKTLANFTPVLKGASIGSFIFLCIIIALIILRSHLLKKRIVTKAPTWDCGYNGSSPRIQYTGSSFTQPVVSFFRLFLFPKQKQEISTTPYAKNWCHSTEVPDSILDKLYTPLFKTTEAFLYRLRWLQGGKVHAYVLYIAITLIALLVWNFVWKK